MNEFLALLAVSTVFLKKMIQASFNHSFLFLPNSRECCAIPCLYCAVIFWTTIEVGWVIGMAERNGAGDVSAWMYAFFVFLSASTLCAFALGQCFVFSWFSKVFILKFTVGTFV